MHETIEFIFSRCAVVKQRFERHSRGAEKGDKRFQPITDVPNLPRVLLIGDSISIGYTLKVRDLLKDKANLHRIPTNGGDSDSGMEKLTGWLGGSKWDVIHFNWGLHDIKNSKGKNQVPLEAYENNLRTMVVQLKATGARLIWCSTTPVPDVKMTPVRLNSDVLAYNAAAKKIWKKTGWRLMIFMPSPRRNWKKFSFRPTCITAKTVMICWPGKSPKVSRKCWTKRPLNKAN